MTPEEIKNYDKSILSRDWSDSFIVKMCQIAYGIDPGSEKIPMSSTYGGDTEFSNEFVEKMKKAILLSHEKYGWMADTYPTLAKAIDCATDRVEAYMKTHNKDYLVDIANFSMIEYMRPSFTTIHFGSKIMKIVDSDNIRCMADRIKMYIQTTNWDYLVDLAVYAMKEYMHPSYDDAHYTPGDSDKSIGLAGGISYKQLKEEMDAEKTRGEY